MPGTPMQSEQWPNWVLPIVRHTWKQKMSAIKSAAAQFYNTQTSTVAIERSEGIGDFGLVPEYNSNEAEKGGDSIQYESLDPLFETFFTHKEYAKGTAIARKLYDDDQTGLIRQRASTLGNSFGTTLAVHQASPFNNAFNSAVVGGDGKSLVATDHPMTKSGTKTFSNKLNLPLSYPNVITAIQRGKRLKDDKGNPMPSIFRVLYVPIELQAKAWEITKAVNKPGGADNDANALQDPDFRLITVVDEYLESDKNWFMLDPIQSALHLLWYWRVLPEINIDPASNFNLVARYAGYMRYSFGWDDARWIIGSEAP